MPQNLKEISGLSFYKDNQLACVNDEKGTVFIYDLASQEGYRNNRHWQKWRLRRHRSCR